MHTSWSPKTNTFRLFVEDQDGLHFFDEGSHGNGSLITPYSPPLKQGFAHHGRLTHRVWQLFSCCTCFKGKTLAIQDGNSASYRYIDRASFVSWCSKHPDYLANYGLTAIPKTAEQVRYTIDTIRSGIVTQGIPPDPHAIYQLHCRQATREQLEPLASSHSPWLNQQLVYQIAPHLVDWGRCPPEAFVECLLKDPTLLHGASALAFLLQPTTLDSIDWRTPGLLGLFFLRTPFYDSERDSQLLEIRQNLLDRLNPVELAILLRQLHKERDTVALRTAEASSLCFVRLQSAVRELYQLQPNSLVDLLNYPFIELGLLRATEGIFDQIDWNDTNVIVQCIQCFYEYHRPHSLNSLFASFKAPCIHAFLSVVWDPNYSFSAYTVSQFLQLFLSCCDRTALEEAIESFLLPNREQLLCREGLLPAIVRSNIALAAFCRKGASFILLRDASGNTPLYYAIESNCSQEELIPLLFVPGATWTLPLLLAQNKKRNGLLLELIICRKALKIAIAAISSLSGAQQQELSTHLICSPQPLLHCLALSYGEEKGLATEDHLRLFNCMMSLLGQETLRQQLFIIAFLEDRPYRPFDALFKWHPSALNQFFSFASSLLDHNKEQLFSLLELPLDRDDAPPFDSLAHLCDWKEPARWKPLLDLFGLKKLLPFLLAPQSALGTSPFDSLIEHPLLLCRFAKQLEEPLPGILMEYRTRSSKTPIHSVLQEIAAHSACQMSYCAESNELRVEKVAQLFAFGERQLGKELWFQQLSSYTLKGESLFKTLLNDPFTSFHCFSYLDKPPLIEHLSTRKSNLPPFLGEGLTNLHFAFYRLHPNRGNIWTDYCQELRSHLGEETFSSLFETEDSFGGDLILKSLLYQLQKQVVLLDELLSYPLPAGSLWIHLIHRNRKGQSILQFGGHDSRRIGRYLLEIGDQLTSQPTPSPKQLERLEFIVLQAEIAQLHDEPLEKIALTAEQVDLEMVRYQQELPSTLQIALDLLVAEKKKRLEGKGNHYMALFCLVIPLLRHREAFKEAAWGELLNQLLHLCAPALQRRLSQQLCGLLQSSRGQQDYLSLRKVVPNRPELALPLLLLTSTLLSEKDRLYLAWLVAIHSPKVLLKHGPKLKLLLEFLQAVTNHASQQDDWPILAFRALYWGKKKETKRWETEMVAGITALQLTTQSKTIQEALKIVQSEATRKSHECIQAYLLEKAKYYQWIDEATRGERQEEENNNRKSWATKQREIDQALQKLQEELDKEQGNLPFFTQLLNQQITDETEGLISLEELQRCNDLFDQRYPNGPLIYLFRLFDLPDMNERRLLIQAFSSFVETAFDLKLFRDKRYALESSLHLRTLDAQQQGIVERFSQLPTWWNSQQVAFMNSLAEESAGGKATMRPDRLIRVALGDDHLAKEKSEYLVRFLQAAPDSRRSLVEELRQAIHTPALEIDDKLIRLWKGQLLLIELLSFKSGDCQLQELPTQIQQLKTWLQLEENSLFANDLDLLEKLLSAAPKAANPTQKATMPIILSDHPVDLLLSGTEVAGSCQHIHGEPESNCGLLGLVSGGHLLALGHKKRPDGPWQSRVLLRLLVGEPSACLFFERIYPTLLPEEEKRQLMMAASAIAHQLDVPLITKAKEGLGANYEGTVQLLKGSSPFEYVDGLSIDGEGGLVSGWPRDFHDTCYLLPQ